MENNVEQIKKIQKTPYVRYRGAERLKAVNRTEKICNKCGALKPLDEYEKQKECIDGHVGMCKACCLERSRRWVAANPERVKRSGYNYRVKNPYRCWAALALNNHRVKGDIVKITKDTLEELSKQTSHCPVCGRLLDYSPFKGKIYDNSPSLDRVDNGNVLDDTNIMIVCNSCNRTKGSRSFSGFVEYCKQILQRKR